MAAEVENPPVTTEEKQEEAPVVAVEAPVVEAAKDAAPPAEEAKEAPAPVKEPAPKKPNVHKQNFEKDVVYLYQFARTTSLPSLSPYVLKVETWLRLTGLKYEVSSCSKPLLRQHFIYTRPNIISHSISLNSYKHYYLNPEYPFNHHHTTLNWD